MNTNQALEFAMGDLKCINGTWTVITGGLHPWGRDSVGYPSYEDARAGYDLAVIAWSAVDLAEGTSSRTYREN